MSDAADWANDIAEQERQRQIVKLRGGQVGTTVMDCEDCGIEIPKARKDAYPNATCCINCQELREKNA